MKYSKLAFQLKNRRTFAVLGCLFFGSLSFAQTGQAEPVSEPKMVSNEYPTDPVDVPADLKSYTIEQKALVTQKSENSKAESSANAANRKTRVGFVGIANPSF